MTEKNLIEVSENYNSLVDQYINKYYGLAKEKLEILSDNMGKIFRTGVLFNLAKRGLISQIEIIGEDYGWYDGFFEVSVVSEDYIKVFSLDRSSFEIIDLDYVSEERRLNLQEDTLIYALVKLDVSRNMPKRYLGIYESLTDKENEMVNSVFEEYPMGSNIDILFENVVMARIIQYFLKPLEETLNNNGEYIRTKYSSEEISTGTMAITNMSKYALLKPGVQNIYDIDFKEYLENEIKEGNFILEGSIENYLKFIQDLYKLESKKNPELYPVYKDFLELNKYVFDFKEIQKQSNPVTPSKLVDLLENHLSLDSYMDINILKIPFFYEGLNDLHQARVTPKKKQITAQTSREFFESFYGADDLASHEDKKLLEFVNSFLYSNKYITYDSSNNISVLPRIMSYLSPNPFVLIANTLTGIFIPQVFEKYIGRVNIDYQELIFKIKDGIIEEDFSQIKQLDPGEESLEILTILGLLEYDGYNYKLTDIGHIYKMSIEDSKTKGKVLEFDFKAIK